jgi:hypothetical protein
MTDAEPNKGTRSNRHPQRLLAYGLAGLWIVSGLLQAQPALFSSAIMVNVLVPVVEREPAWFSHVVLWGDKLWSSHLASANLAVVVGEIGLGLIISLGPFRKTGRVGLWLSIVWSLIVWCFGEGFGGILTGNASMIYQFPGPAVLYGLIAGLLLLPQAWWTEDKVRRGVTMGIGWLWIMGAVLQALPAAGFWTGSRLAGLFGDVTMAGGEPAGIARLINVMIQVTLGHPFVSNVLLVLIMAALGIGWLKNPGSRWLRTATWVWLLFLWMVPQAFGTLFTGTATNPGMVWPLALLIVVAARPKTMLHKIDNLGNHKLGMPEPEAD